MDEERVEVDNKEVENLHVKNIKLQWVEIHKTSAIKKTSKSEKKYLVDSSFISKTC